MSNTKSFVSDEACSTIGKSVVFSTAPKIAATTAEDPYKILNQKDCSIQLRLMPYSDGKGGKRSVFNLSWPQYDLLSTVIKQAMFFKISHWDLAEVWDGTQEMDRVFGNPLPPSVMMSKFPDVFKNPSEAQGYCPARILKLRRDSVRQDGSKATYPWYIEIRNGYAKKHPTQNGGAYMERRTFVEESSSHINLSDGQMYEHAFWNEKVMETFVSAATPSIIKAHNALMQQKQDWQKQQNTMS